MKNYYIPYLLSILIFCACNNNNQRIEKNEKGFSDLNRKKCPCDSIYSYSEVGKAIIDCFEGKSFIRISQIIGNDTFDIRRYYKTNNGWNLQEVIEVKDNELVNSTYAIICDIIDTANFYNLVYYSNDDLYINQGLITNSVYGVQLELERDTINSKSVGILVPKDKLKGSIRFVKKVNITYRGKTEDKFMVMFIDADYLIKYGNLLEQFKAIKKYCRDVKL